MRSYYCTTAALILVLLTGCATTRAKIVEYRDRQDRQEQVEKIVERTITKPQIVEKEVIKYVPLPATLTAPCFVEYARDKRVGSITEAYKRGIPLAEDCAERMRKIKALQPVE